MSTIKTNIIEPLGTAITISGAAHFTSGNAVLGGLTATNQINANGGLSVNNGIVVSTGGISVTGGIAGTLTTAEQPNITSLGSLSSLTLGSASMPAQNGSASLYPARGFLAFDSESAQHGRGLTAAWVDGNQRAVTVTFTTPMPTANYTVIASVGTDTSNRLVVVQPFTLENQTETAPTTTSFRLGFFTLGGAATTPRRFAVSVFHP